MINIIINKSQVFLNYKGVLSYMNRRKSREQAFILLFESSFELQSKEEIIELAQSVRGEKLSSFAKELFKGTIDKNDEIDNSIEHYLQGWKKERLSKVVLAILRLATFEMLYHLDTPVGVSINEAVELAKKYATKEYASYINGVLSAINKNTNIAKS